MNGRIWYCVNKIGMATACNDEQDALETAAESEKDWPHMAPHRVMRLVDAAELDELKAENASLLAELEAVGAGGVQPLRAQAGWALVPVEPTQEMLEAAVQAICYGPEGGFTRIGGPHTCWQAMLAAAPKAPQQAAQEPVHGDVLPPVGSRVFIRHGRDDDAHACTVTGYYAWGDLKGDKRLHRVFVRMVYEGTECEQSRMLCDCYPTAESALAEAAPQQAAPSQKPKLRVGQVWRTRGGHVVEIVFTKNGTFYESAQHPNDLIELISDAQEGGEA